LRVSEHVDDVPEVWVRDLATWLVHQFLDVALSRIGNEEAALREWEAAATRGREIGARVDASIASFEARGWRGLAKRVGASRRHVRKAIHGKPAKLVQDIAELALLLDGYEALERALEKLVSIARGRDLDVDVIVARFDPKETDPKTDVTLVERVTSLLEDMDERIPPSSGAELRSWLATLQAHLEQSRDRRLQSRLGAYIGVEAASTVSELYETHVALVERLWPTLSDAFVSGLLNEFLVTRPTNTDEIAAAVGRAVDKHGALSGGEVDAWEQDLWAALVARAAEPETDTAAMRADLDARLELTAWTHNQSGALAPLGLLQDLVSTANSYAAAVELAGKFEDAAGRIWKKIAVLELDIGCESIEGEDADAYLEDLRGQLEVAEQELIEHEDQLEAFSSVMELLGACLPATWGGDSLAEAREAVDDAERATHEALSLLREELESRAAKLRVVVNIQPLEDEAADAASLLAHRQRLEELEERTREATRLGLPWLPDRPVPVADCSEVIDLHLASARQQVAGLQRALERVHLKAQLFRTDLRAAATEIPGNISDLRAALGEWNDSLRSTIATREDGLGDGATQIWKSITGSDVASQAAGLRELLDVGLLVAATAEEDV